MATTVQLPAQAAEPTREGEALAGAGTQALVPAARAVSLPEPLKLGPAVARLPVELDVAVQVREFRVRNLLALDSGQVIETEWKPGDDLPLAAGEVQLAWSEFEVLESRLAVRVTRLA